VESIPQNIETIQAQKTQFLILLSRKIGHWMLQIGHRFMPRQKSQICLPKSATESCKSTTNFGFLETDFESLFNNSPPWL